MKYTVDDIHVGTTLVATPPPSGSYDIGRLIHVAMNVGRDNITFDSCDNGVWYVRGEKMSVAEWLGYMNGEPSSMDRLFTVEQPAPIGGGT